jgi:NAD(P)-dependent dehydrogenase (short-subunit alcohol dehydrogenase family)
MTTSATDTAARRALGQFRMTGKVAVITGGSQGIGAGVVAGYRSLGWGVVACALKMPPAEDPEVLSVEGDIAQPETVERIMDTALRRYGRIDTLVNNAGVYISKPFTDYTPTDYAVITGVNLTGWFWLTKRVIADMLARDGGHVVNISATIAEVANSGTPAGLTALTKGGLAAATRSLAIEYAARGIRVNAISPGIIQTPMHPPESYADLGDQMPPIGRVGQVSDVVDAILFLESSAYITGEILHVDGGPRCRSVTLFSDRCCRSVGARRRGRGRQAPPARRPAGTGPRSTGSRGRPGRRRTP